MRYSTDCPIYRRFIEHLHSLGPRVLGEFIADVSNGKPLAELVERYGSLTHEALEITGANSWPTMQPYLVPDADQ